MTIQDILDQTEHRTTTLPADAWIYYQEWNSTLFLHWEVDVHALRPLLPAGLEPDLFEGKAWVSLVAFTMENVRPRYLPAFPPLSDFDEVNVRTYVKHHGIPGVYFLSIEAGGKLACKVARGLSGLPYRYAQMRREANMYQSRNLFSGDSLSLAFDVGPEITNKAALDKWLTERYALFQDSATAIHTYEIHHLEWPLQELDLQRAEIHYPRFAALIGRTPDIAHYSPGVKVVAWRRRSAPAISGEVQK